MSASFFHDQFVDSIDQCRQLYVDKVVECFVASPSRLGMEADEFFAVVQDRFNCLVIKAFVETAESDLVLTPAEADLAKVLVEHLLDRQVKPRHVKENFRELATLAKQTSWGAAVEPMKWFEETAAYFEEVKSALLRIATIASRVDGSVRGETTAQLKMIRMQLDQHLPVVRSHSAESKPVNDASESTDVSDHSAATNSYQISQALIKVLSEQRESKRAAPMDASALESNETSPVQESATVIAQSNASDTDAETVADLTPQQRDELLRLGMAELENLIGIDAIRREVQTLINVCKLQQFRKEHSMPVSTVSLHMVFTGNPGTGKTTVARIVAKLFGAIGVIRRGHLIETDRSGLVAEFQGQTGPKTNAKIDEAIDGVLFVDEAYSLAPENQSDSYGLEAIQTLLKRMEDDRDRLIVILAGYPKPMETLMKSNPGLSSRFSRRCHFPDYDETELAGIFDVLAQKHHYHMTDDFRSTFLKQIRTAVATKDEHFGNGRMVRNLYECAIRNMANRVVESAELTPELLSTFQAEDLSEWIEGESV
ncbi:AAA family ATPase [Planctomycetes bacterium K23_9]|uniref:Stage V sporulation protein K n=1 Tax=Stieleria marina TaxID=1930275 RepID=A0A517NYI5_9BACT|nr:Stage V sporulation protein K [Planctomycetes bacterium K23_9]